MKIFRNRWVLAILAILLWVGSQAGFYIMKFGGPGDGHAEEDAHLRGAPGNAPKTLSWNFVTPAIDELRQELAKRLSEVAVREKELEDYHNRLSAERGELEKLKNDLGQIRDQLEKRRAEFFATILEVKEGEEKNLKTLAATYTTLTPAAALAIFREMDDDAVVRILAFMKPDPVGQILEEMARTRDGDGTLAARAAAISNKLRLKFKKREEENS